MTYEKASKLIVCTGFLIISLCHADKTPYAKSTRTYYDEALLTRINQTIEKYQWAKDQFTEETSSISWIMNMSDQELWDFIPPPEQIRAINVSHDVGCPIHGKEIYKIGGHYPWITSRDKPFKVKCPIDGKEFPENDFVTWNIEGRDGIPESGENIIDKGIGWVDKDGNRYYFVAYYVFWQRWMKDIIGGLRGLSHAYLLTGNAAYAHKAAIILSKIASDYERFDYRIQGYHEGSWNINGRISDYVWTTGNDSEIALAYDAIFPIFDEDYELIKFLSKKGITNPRDHIELNMLNVMVTDLITGYVKGNMGSHQLTMCHLAIILDNTDPKRGYTKNEIVEWLMTGEGKIEDLLWNGFWRDGFGSESAPKYARIWGNNFYNLAILLPKIGISIWDNPKLKKMADIVIDMTVAGKFWPSIGDGGGVLGFDPIVEVGSWWEGLLGPAFMLYKDTNYAKALALTGVNSKDLWMDYFDEDEVAGIVAKYGKEIDLKTRNIGGYGLAILESGKGDNKRGVSMYYGDASGGHGHSDRLTLEFFAHGVPMLPDMGYPTPANTPKARLWTSNTISHYSVLINQSPQTTMHAGHLNTLAASPEIQLMDASAEISYNNSASLYRRTTSLIDINEENSYLLDIFRVSGGTQHDWSFHGPAHFTDFSIVGAESVSAQERGTLSGDNIDFGAEISQVLENDYGWELELSKGEGILTGDYGPLSLEGWACCLLTRKTDSQAIINTNEIPAGKVKVFIHVYDYNDGKNLIGLTLGGLSRDFPVEPSGSQGFRWVSQIYNLPEPFTKVVLTAKEVGQPYLQIDRIIIAKDIYIAEPLGFNDKFNGYQYLYNIRRMKPQGTWSAIWKKPNENMALTMTMPSGSTQEIIIADAEPELQPNNPDVLNYIIGRNVLDNNDSKESFSKYIAVIEPYKDEASITSVETMKSRDGSDMPVGLIIHRGEEIDLIHSALVAGEHYYYEGTDTPFVTDAEFAVLTVDEKGFKRAFMVNGTILQYGEFLLESSPQPVGKVYEVDHKRNAVRINKFIEKPEFFRNNVIIFNNELRQSSYTIKNVIVENDLTTLEFGDELFIVGLGEVVAVDQTINEITSDRDLYGYGRIDGGRHAGRWLYNEDKSQGFRIAKVQGRSFHLENVSGNMEDIFGDKDGDGRRLYWISDIGPGDSFRINRTTYMKRVQSKDPEVQSITDHNSVTEVTNITDKSCFIATIAYGSYLNPHVYVLREFRNNFLLTNLFGKALVHFYYRTSPPIANFIRNHEVLKIITRFFLLLVVYVVKFPSLILYIITGFFVTVILFKKKHIIFDIIQGEIL